MGSGKVDELLAAGGHQQTWFFQGTQVVLLQQGRGFLHFVGQHLGSFQLLIALAPMVLPVKGETTHGQHANAQPEEGAIGGPMEIGHPGGPPVELAT